MLQESIKRSITRILSVLWLLLAPVALFYGGLVMMIDQSSGHWSLIVGQFIWLVSGLIYLGCGITALVFLYKDKQPDSAFKTALFPLVIVLLQLLSSPFLNA